MGRRVRGGRRHAGGIAALAGLAGEHASALDYDLLTRTGHTLRDVGGALPWGALLHFVQHLDHTSELWRETHPEAARALPWLDGTALPSLVADLIDAVNLARWEQACMSVPRGHARPRQPRPYPRPWGGDTSERRIGSDPIPVADFEDWWESKGREAGGG